MMVESVVRTHAYETAAGMQGNLLSFFSLPRIGNLSPCDVHAVCRRILPHGVCAVQSLSRRGLDVVWEPESRCLEFCGRFAPCASRLLGPFL